ncbi:serine hydrolase [Paenibacillus methanolicus]|uniref:CubicO group peptidase (Beta-lactamase class C family) n=1 Tax=Paenibacillus methanolicus TaxID=582686 RepID=A0A5S5C5E9_9BACL|nr:serine hydrolase [Paenibacillus methanolicus]TYP74547.1 CubicO group peptidase (beta-lactamase class C family) [Paenibacillus methanolicus]
MKSSTRNKKRTQAVMSSLVAVALLAIPAGAYAQPHSSPLAAAASASAHPATAITAQEAKAFADAYFAKPEVQANLAGALVVIVKGNDVLINQGYGYADVTAKKKIDPNQTLFRIASISKVVTATAVMQLAEQGKIDLTKDVSTYLPGIRISNSTGTAVTTEHLLTHTAGFDYTDVYRIPPGHQGTEVTIEEMLSANEPSVVRKPGEAYRYDNLGYTMLGHIIQNAAKQPFEDYMEQQLFEPLQMKHATFRVDEQNFANLAIGYQADMKPLEPYPLIPTISPGGGMFATGVDMANFIKAHLNDGQFGGTRILKEDTAKLMHKQQYELAPGVPMMAYGFESFFHSSHNGQYVIGKGGDLAGYHSWLWLLPEQNVGGMIVANSDASIGIRQQFFDAFMDHFYPDQKQPQPDIALPADQLAAFEGIYRSLRAPILATKVSAINGELQVSDSGGTRKLRAIGPLLFEDENGDPAAFKKDAEGNVAYLYHSSLDSMYEKVEKAAPYADVSETSPYAADIQFLRSMQAFDDEGALAFRPEEPMTRAEFVSILARFSGQRPSPDPVAFRDVQGHPLASWIQTAAELGGLTGTNKQLFEPDRAVTRQEAAAFLWRVANHELGLTPLEAKLSSQPAAWAKEGLHFIAAKGMYGPEIKTDAGGAVDFKPDTIMTRQEAAAMYARFIQKLFLP